MPRKPRKVANRVETTSKQDDEGPSQVSATSQSSAASQETLNANQAVVNLSFYSVSLVPIEQPVPSPSTSAAKLECPQNKPEAVNITSETTEDNDKLPVEKPQNVTKCITNESEKQQSQIKKKICGKKSVGNKTVEQLERRRERKRFYAKNSIANETAERRELRRQKAHQKYLKRKANESEEVRQERLERKRQHYIAIFKATEASHQRERRLERQRQINLKRKMTETVEQRKLRLEKMREYEAKRKASENVERREQRLQRARQYDLKRRTNPSVEQRERNRKRQREYSLRCKAKKKIKDDNIQLANLSKCSAQETVEQSEIPEEMKDQATIKIIKRETSRRVYEKCDNFPPETADEPVKETPPTRSYISQLVSGESPPDVIINIRKCVSKQRSKTVENDEQRGTNKTVELDEQRETNKSVEQDEHHIPELEHATLTVCENVEKRELQDVTIRIADETVEHGKQDGLQLKEEGGQKAKDVMKKVMQNYDFVSIKTEPISQEYDQFCDLAALQSIASPKPCEFPSKVNFEESSLYECASVQGLSDNEIKTEDGVPLDGEYELKRVLKMEIDIGPEEIQRIVSDGRTSTEDELKYSNDGTPTLLKRQLTKDVTLVKLLQK